MLYLRDLQICFIVHVALNITIDQWVTHIVWLALGLHSWFCLQKARIDLKKWVFLILPIRGIGVYMVDLGGGIYFVINSLSGHFLTWKVSLPIQSKPKSSYASEKKAISISRLRWQKYLKWSGEHLFKRVLKYT